MIDRIRVALGIALLVGIGFLFVGSRQIIDLQHGKRYECSAYCATSEESKPSYFSQLRAKTLDDPVALWTCLLALGTLGLAGSAIYQIREARRTSERQLRAHVGAQADSTLPNLSFGHKQTWRVIFKGYGQTPALRARYWGDLVIREYPLTGPLPSLPFRTDIRPINPTQQIAIAFETNNILTVIEATEIGAGNKRMFLYGELEYFDIFGERHTTTFKYMYGGPRLIGSGYGATCDDGNDQT